MPLLKRLTAAVAVILLFAGVLFALAVVKPAPRSATAQSAPETPSRPDTRELPTRELIGLDPAWRRLRLRLPTGEGVAVGHVEGNPGHYLPNTDADHFKGVTFTPRSGPSETFGHADATARVIYGPKGLAPGISAVHAFSSIHWITRGYLHAGEPRPPEDTELRLFTHSWIGNENDGSVEVLRRVDYAIDAYDVVICAGVNNGRTSGVPALLGSAYNVIAVGSSSGASSGGYTTVEGEGRCKPDIVGPRQLTSFTTPMVTAMVARLIEAADALGPHAERAGRAEVIKAVLLAGATKPWNWKPQPGKPLDEHLGAGMVNLDHSLTILQSPPPDAGTLAADTAGTADLGTLDALAGWDFRVLEPEQTAVYEFEVADPPKEISIVLTWHRRIDGRIVPNLLTGRPEWLDRPTLANYDLRLSFTDAAGRTGPIGRSTSDIDNVEHIYIASPPPGRYRLEVVRRADGHAEPWDYALAWRFTPTF